MLKDLVAKNRSYRGYDEGYALTREQLVDMVDAARLTPFSQNFQSFKYHLSWTAEENAKIQPLTGWARWLQSEKLPRPGKCPTGFIIICYDNTIGPGAQRFQKDVGIVAQTILLRAVEMGLGGIMIGNFSPERIAAALELPANLEPQLILAVGKPNEEIVLTDIPESGEINYYRDGQDIHYVPKRKLEDLLLN